MKSTEAIQKSDFNERQAPQMKQGRKSTDP